jgi:hypothetical protein
MSILGATNKVERLTLKAYIEKCLYFIAAENNIVIGIFLKNSSGVVFSKPGIY